MLKPCALVSAFRALALAALLSMVAPLPAFAREPAPRPANNPVGINLVRWFDPFYVKAVGDLVNASGGDWGYVTIVMIEDERLNVARFQAFLDQCAISHLTPIIRVGTRFDVDREVWAKPDWGEPARWRRFFDSVRWPTASRHLLVGNEPNLGREWGGEVQPAEYARYLSHWIDIFADEPRYVIYNGALDASNDTHLPDRMDEFEFIAGMRDGVSNIFEKLHGWASNPYHFWWSAEKRRFTFRAYDHELEVIGRDLPVIIVESGLGHIDDPGQVADYYQMAFEAWQADSRVLAATPLFWNPEENRFWMFDVNRDGTLRESSPTYERIRRLKKSGGSRWLRIQGNDLVLEPEPAPIAVAPAVPMSANAQAGASGAAPTLPPSMASPARLGVTAEEDPVRAR
ncbi:MAG: hypothetical protein U0821_07870 [Chloroflexota bacterium]